MAEGRDTYRIHDSADLVQLFRESPFQGQSPEKAKVLFLGIDANYSEKISDHPFFARIVEYHKDGVAFWQRHGRHHPFMLDEYPFKRNTGGLHYHRAFAKMKLTPDYAPHVSFVELLNVPTIGVSSGQEKTFWELFDPNHARWLDSIINDGSPRIVFLSNNVIRRMQKARKKWGLFSWIPDDTGHGLICRTGASEIHKIYHFSDGRVHSQLQEMRDLVDVFCW